MRLMLAAALTAVAFPAAAESDLTLTLENVRAQTGQVVVALFDSEAAYKAKGRPIRTATLPASGAKVDVAWSGLKPGAYAAVAFHDRDSDGKLDTLPIGLPIEPLRHLARRPGPLRRARLARRRLPDHPWRQPPVGQAALGTVAQGLRSSR
jgi:uncharacterized protein (DUF2141 family)